MRRAAAASPRIQILKLEKKLFLENKVVINDATQVADPGFKKYWRNYKKAIRTYQKVSNMTELLEGVARARVILVGDYHTLDQSQRSFVRLLRTHFEANRDKKITVALEAVQARFQKALEDFMLGKADSESFIRRIGFKKHWFFDLWSNYEVVFDYLIYHHVPMAAIDADNRKKMSLLERDAFMAERIVKLVKDFPDEKIFVLVGDLHLAPEHLPRAVKKLAAKEKLTLPILTLYQNSPEIHWQLSEKGLVEHADVVRIGPTEFCRQHTPPLVVQQSYLNWLTHEDDTFDWADAKVSFLHLVSRVAEITGLGLPMDHEDVEVYTCGDLSFLKTIKKKKLFSKNEFDFIKEQVERSRSCYLPRARIAYIANVSLHHAAEEATHYLKSLYSGEEFPRLRQDAFYAGVLHEAIGFFGSKLVNPKRKCPRLQDFKKDIRYFSGMKPTEGQRLNLKTAELFIKHSGGVKSGKLITSPQIASLSSELFLALANAIGYDLGDHLYYGFMSGQIAKDVIQALFTERFEEPGETGQMYLSLVKKLKSVKRPPKI